LGTPRAAPGLPALKWHVPGKALHRRSPRRLLRVPTGPQAQMRSERCESVDLGGQVEVFLRKGADRVRRYPESDLVPPDVDVGVVAHAFGGSAHLVDKAERLGEVLP